MRDKLELIAYASFIAACFTFTVLIIRLAWSVGCF